MTGGKLKRSGNIVTVTQTPQLGNDNSKRRHKRDQDLDDEDDVN